MGLRGRRSPRAAWVAALLASLLLAGCAKSDEPVALESVPTGVLEGAVTDVALSPLAGVNVTVADGNQTALTDGAGAFRFVLEPGEHLLVFRLEGYVHAAARATVVAGQSVGLNVTLAQVPKETPRVESVEASGLISCALVLKNGAEAQQHACPSQDANARPSLDFEVGDLAGLAGIVVELDWDAGSKASEELALHVTLVAGESETPMGRIEGRAPLSMTLPARILEGALAPGVVLRASATPAGSLTDDESALDAGAAMQQPFTVYVSTFYHEAPPAGFTVLQS